MLRAVGALGAMIAFVAAGSAGTASATAQELERPAVFVTLPMTNGFADATEALVEAQGLVYEALADSETVRLVDFREDSDVVLTMLGQGTGHVELTAALRSLDRGVVVSPVPIHATERYIEAMLTVGSCGQAAVGAPGQATSAPCYRKVFVGLGYSDHDARQGAASPAPNSWKACAEALARDVQAWVAQNASRLQALRS